MGSGIIGSVCIVLLGLTPLVIIGLAMFTE